MSDRKISSQLRDGSLNSQGTSQHSGSLASIPPPIFSEIDNQFDSKLSKPQTISKFGPTVSIKQASYANLPSQLNKPDEIPLSKSENFGISQISKEENNDVKIETGKVPDKQLLISVTPNLQEINQAKEHSRVDMMNNQPMLAISTKVTPESKVDVQVNSIHKSYPSPHGSPSKQPLSRSDQQSKLQQNSSHPDNIKLLARQYPTRQNTIGPSGMNSEGSSQFTSEENIGEIWNYEREVGDGGQTNAKSEFRDLGLGGDSGIKGSVGRVALTSSEQVGMSDQVQASGENAENAGIENFIHEESVDDNPNPFVPESINPNKPMVVSEVLDIYDKPSLNQYDQYATILREKRSMTKDKAIQQKEKFNGFRVGKSKSLVPFHLKLLPKFNIDGLIELIKINKHFLGNHFHDLYKPEFATSEFVSPISKTTDTAAQEKTLSKIKDKIKTFATKPITTKLLSKRLNYLQESHIALPKLKKRIENPLEYLDYMDTATYLHLDTEQLRSFYQHSLIHRLKQSIDEVLTQPRIGTLYPRFFKSYPGNIDQKNIESFYSTL